MNEMIFLGACPIIRPEGIYYEGRKVISLGLGDVGDLLAYRQEWEPFIAAHLDLWRYVNGLLEGIPSAQTCPPGISDPLQAVNISEFCLFLDLTRIRISDTNPGGILQQWNAWSGKSSADMVAGASDMLKWYQSVVTQVAGPYKDELVRIANAYNITLRLPDVPDFSAQQELIARIEGAYVTTKGVLQILGYGAGEVLEGAANVTQATAQGLSETAKGIKGVVTSAWTWIGVAAVLAIVGGALVVYYVPRRRPAQ